MVGLTKNRTERFHEIELDLEQWQNLYYKHQKAYIRKRLLAIKYLYEGKSRLQVCKLLGCAYNTLNTWIDKFIEGGLTKLVEGIKHANAPQRLSHEQKQELKQMILEHSPRDYGIARNIWTADIMIEVIQQQWSISLKRSRMYEILHELGLSYQKAHRDYRNGNSVEQTKFVNALKKLETVEKTEKMVFFDEFAVYDRPSLFYGWAEVNTRFEVPSDEKRKRNKVNGFLSVDAVSGTENLLLLPHSKSHDVAHYLALVCDDAVEEGYTKLTIYLDNNSTHKEKMRSRLTTLLSDLELNDKITVEFIDIPAYSPKFNLAKYIIHQIRLKVLHQMPVDATITTIRKELETVLENAQFQTAEQIKKTLRHICNLVPQS
ncbi:MAG: IS630 family transposase [Symploca sp. SIO3C6]|nr:IS630 family transposase [Symploca sp. SIO3C6]